jgi:hypothetical protein
MRAVPIVFTAILIVAGLGLGVAHAFTIDKGALSKPDGGSRFADPDDALADRLTGDSSTSTTAGRPNLRIVPNTGSSFYSDEDAAREQQLFPGGNGAILPPGRRR